MKPVDRQLIVHFLRPISGRSRAHWPVDRAEEMTYRDYLALKPGDMANTKVVRFIDAG